MAHDFEKFEADVEEKLVRHDEDVIDNKRGDLNEHEAELAKDKNGLLRDIRKEEIKHDEKVIARKEKDAAKHEAAAKKHEEEVTGK